MKQMELDPEVIINELLENVKQLTFENAILKTQIKSIKEGSDRDNE